MWGKQLRQRLRLAPLYAAILLADRFAPVAPKQAAARRLPKAHEGISVLIPDRDAPELLVDALHSVETALAPLAEPQQIVVVANGAPAARYSDLTRKYPTVEWLHDAQACGFGEAIHRGLARVRYDWTLLLNNDMTLEPTALVQLAAHRAPDLFAVAPQILQHTPGRGREETGFVDWYVDASGVHVYHVMPGPDDELRTHLCASGGAGLYRTSLLRRYVRAARAYDPFYWEDVEWGVRAWRDGFRVTFCPAARCSHRHRATVGRFYAPAEIDRIVERNRILFDIRNAITDEGAEWLLERVCDQPYASQQELARPLLAVRTLRHRWQARRRPAPSPPAIALPDGKPFEPRPSFTYRFVSSEGRPKLLLVTPFCIFPARHGGARRIEGLLKVLRREFAVVLVSDEASLYDLRSYAYFDGLHAVQLVQPRDPRQPAAALDQRIEAHCHEDLRRAVQQALQRYRPELVQIEHIELAALSRMRMPGQRWILGLHDAYMPSDFSNPDAARHWQDHVLATYDAVTVCSPEDERLSTHPRTVCVPNGTSFTAEHSSPDSRRMLFMGPFRYAQNLQGIRRFLSLAYPRIKSAVPEATLSVLGGDGAPESVVGDQLFAQPGVSVLGHRDEVRELLAECALTINPLCGIRGSSVKVIESLAAGRACVSTEEGARGFHGAGFSGLVTVSEVADMAVPVIELLTETEKRRRIEMPSPSELERFQWRHCAGIQSALYRTLLESAHA